MSSKPPVRPTFTDLEALIEFGATDNIFIKPKRKETEYYITGRFG